MSWVWLGEGIGEWKGILGIASIKFKGVDLIWVSECFKSRR